MNQTASAHSPVKTREIHNHHMDSTRWNDFKFRDDDIIIATYAKSGTTWMQQIISQLLHNGAEGVDFHSISPWIDFRIMPPEVYVGLEQQKNRRFMKTHLPVDALVFSPKAKYLYIARDGRDMVWSMFNHHAKANEHWYGAINNTPGRIGPAIEPPPNDPAVYFREWLEKDGYPFWSFWESVRSWWNVRHLPNVKLVHFNDLKKDLAGEIRGIGEFLGIHQDNATFQKIVEHCGFDYMKAHAEAVAPLGGALWDGGADTFINKGTNGRWKDALTQADIKTYEGDAVRELGADCARWLATGGKPA